MELQEIRSLAERVRENVAQVIVGKEEMIEAILIALIAKGHILLEDVPGTGKTLLAKAVARSLDCTSKRVQFTPDLLPSDLTGINFFNQKTGAFEFREGPVFTNLLLADEINRATPRTQSSLLEAMEERQVTIDGETHLLIQPFLVIATQNPVESQGTFPLPEAQLDRFLLQLHMGYPSTAEGMAILRRFQAANPLETLRPVATREAVGDAQASCTAVHIDDEVLRYLLQVVEQTREHVEVELGVSPRGSQALLRAAQVRACLRGRTFVTPDDIKGLAVPVLAHRMVLKPNARRRGLRASDVVTQLLEQVPVPTEQALAE